MILTALDGILCALGYGFTIQNIIRDEALKEWKKKHFMSFFDIYNKFIKCNNYLINRDPFNIGHFLRMPEFQRGSKKYIARYAEKISRALKNMPPLKSENIEYIYAEALNEYKEHLRHSRRERKPVIKGWGKRQLKNFRNKKEIWTILVKSTMGTHVF